MSSLVPSTCLSWHGFVATGSELGSDAESACFHRSLYMKAAAAPAPAPPPAMPEDFGEIAGGGGDRKKMKEETKIKMLTKADKSDLVKKDQDEINVARKTDDQITKGKDVSDRDGSTSTLEVVTVTEHRPTRQEWSPPQTTDGGASRATDTRGRPEASGAGSYRMSKCDVSRFLNCRSV